MDEESINSFFQSKDFKKIVRGSNISYKKITTLSFDCKRELKLLARSYEINFECKKEEGKSEEEYINEQKKVLKKMKKAKKFFDSLDYYIAEVIAEDEEKRIFI